MLEKYPARIGPPGYTGENVSKVFVKDLLGITVTYFGMPQGEN